MVEMVLVMVTMELLYCYWRACHQQRWDWWGALSRHGAGPASSDNYYVSRNIHRTGDSSLETGTRSPDRDVNTFPHRKCFHSSLSNLIFISTESPDFLEFFSETLTGASVSCSPAPSAVCANSAELVNLEHATQMFTIMSDFSGRTGLLSLKLGMILS